MTSLAFRRRLARRTRWAATFLLLAAAGTTGCGDDLDGASSAADGRAGGSGGDCAYPDGEWSEIEARASREGVVRWYSTLAPALNDRLVAAFARAYPDIGVEVTRATSPDLTRRIDAEAQGGARSADLAVHTDQAWQQAHGTTFFAPLVGPDVTDPDHDVLSADRTSTLVALAVIGYGWNTSVIDDPPSSFEDLADPAYEGLVGLYDYEAPPVAASFAIWSEQYGDDFLAALADQDPRFYASGSALAQAVAAGEVGISAYITPALVPEGAPVEIAYPVEPLANAYVANVLCSADDPAAAQVLANWLLTPEAQEVAAQDAASVLGPDAGVDAPFSLDDVRVTDVTSYRDSELAALRRSLDATFAR
ncbi:MAG TPA: extracellular solute-binding protein [Acidimicrobiales bacterium]|nr:extracellular solute-binding protein [Acidimicrobiales bacterium]